MKKTHLLILLFTISLLCVSCTKEGEVIDTPRDIITLNGKTYQATSVVPCDNCSSIWIVYPKDSTGTSSVITVTRPETDDEGDDVSAIIQSN